MTKDNCIKCNVVIAFGGSWGFCSECAKTEVEPIFEEKYND